jgi:hypothetical protein
MIQLDSKLPDVGVTIFTVMSQLANHHQAINLSQDRSQRGALLLCQKSRNTRKGC